MRNGLRVATRKIESNSLSASTGPSSEALRRVEGHGEVSIGNSPPVFLVSGYNDQPALHQQSTLNPQLLAQPSSKWIERFEEWLADSGFLKKL